jgi:hypothetical protein
MIKVESDMLILDSSFTKEDVQAINHFVDITKRQENERIIKLLEPLFDTAENAETRRLLIMAIALIKGENK